MAKKHIRDLREVVEPLGLDVVPSGRSGHFQIRDGQRFVATVAGSPKDPDTCLRRACRDASRYIDQKTGGDR